MAPQFTDRTGRTWHPALTADGIEEARTVLGVDFAALMRRDPRHVFEVLGDPQRMGPLIYLPCHTEAEARGVSPEAFIIALSDGGLSLVRAALAATALAIAAAFPTTHTGRLMQRHLPRLIRESRFAH